MSCAGDCSHLLSPVSKCSFVAIYEACSEQETRVSPLSVHLAVFFVELSSTSQTRSEAQFPGGVAWLLRLLRKTYVATTSRSLLTFPDIRSIDQTTDEVLSPFSQDMQASPLFVFLRRTIFTRPQWTDHYKLQKTVELGLMVVGAAHEEDFNKADEILAKLKWTYFSWLVRFAGGRINPEIEREMDRYLRLLNEELRQEQRRRESSILQWPDFLHILNLQMGGIRADNQPGSTAQHTISTTTEPAASTDHNR